MKKTLKLSFLYAAMAAILMVTGCKNDPPTVPPAGPATISIAEDATALTFSATSIAVKFTPGENAVKFEFAIGKADDLAAFNDGTLTGIEKIDNGEAKTHSFTGLDPETEYTVFAAATNADGVRGETATKKISTTAEPAGPATIMIEEGESTHSSIAVTFTPGENAVKFAFAIGVADDLAAFNDGTLEGIVEVENGNTTPHTFEGLDAEAEYTIFAVATNADDVRGETVTKTISTGVLALPVPDGSLLAGITGGGTPIADPEGTTVDKITTRTYVGAFWRHDQTGERVIKINVGSTNAANVGAWKAQIAWYDDNWDPAQGDGIVLVAGGSTDTGIYGETPGDAENFKVAGKAAEVSGSVAAGEDIVFRIGLTKPYTAFNAASAPARYAVILLTYGGDAALKQKMFLRQGEGADYLFRPGDPNDSGADVAGGRTFARKIAVYNLTAAEINNTDKLAVQLSTNGGVFTDYPTKAGAHFQWGSDTPTLTAMHPGLTPQGVGPFYGTPSFIEVCPAGWHRPRINIDAGDDMTGTFANSEVQQSFLMTPGQHNLSNPIWSANQALQGYYADGFFDRRTLSDTKTGTPDYVDVIAAIGTKDVACIGNVLFNPLEGSDSYNANVFMPSAGYRNVTGDIGVAYMGGTGYYTTANYASTMQWMLQIASDRIGYHYNGYTLAMAMRCVADAQ